MASENTELGAAVKAPAPTKSLKEREALCVQYTPFVRSLATKIKRKMAPEVAYDDLVEYGMIGLLEAIDRFDPDQGAHFMTFAYYRVRGAIYDGLRSMGWMRRSEYARVRNAAQANEYLAEKAMEGSSSAGFESAVNSLAQAVEGLAAVYLTSLDAAEALEIEDAETLPADERLGMIQARRLVRETVAKLPDQERRLLEMYYYEGKNLQEVGATLGASKSWTCRLHARVIDKLHRMLAESLGPD